MKLFALFSILIALAPMQAAQIVAEPFPPAHLAALYIERDEKDTAAVIRMKGDEVTYQVLVAGKVTDSVTVHPSGEDWFKFIQGLNAAKVYKWAPKYEYPGRGISWAVLLVMENRRFSSEGVNDFPKEGAEGEPDANPASGPSVPFQLFWQTALELVGKGPPPAPAK